MSNYINGNKKDSFQSVTFSNIAGKSIRPLMPPTSSSSVTFSSEPSPTTTPTIPPANEKK